MKISKTLPVTYKGQKMTIEEFVLLVAKMSKDEVGSFVWDHRPLVKLTAQYLKDYPEVKKLAAVSK
jgi:hypothetical protein